MPDISRIIQNEVSKYPKGTKIADVREYNDVYVIFLGQPDSKGRIFGNASLPTVNKKTGKVVYTELYDLPVDGYDSVDYKRI